ncbi:SAM-dependent methyltransferase protein [Rhizobium phaseoli]|uniref:TylF/MycF/NovP-related O-methyltransferase n=1 Tax=Rhizobium phaseoli TaxID=396 RepID=UPI0007F0B64E|nr:TylF/MycF/NovP-related O-methyltransferase [Rhizobium phaseoli]ANL26670.1 SAM-dependent methyltransferase protein [Rhizobium phaseoli]
MNENPVQLVVFHVDKGAAVVDRSKYGDFRARDYHKMIGLMWASFRRFHPGSTLTILTDTDSRLKLPGATILRRKIDANRIMYERMVWQRDALSSLSTEYPIFLLDSDMLCLGSFSHLFKDETASFDLALTFRRSHNSPINGGLLIVNTGEKTRKRVIDMMSHMIDNYAGMSEDEKTWFGDQVALRDLVALHHSKMRNLNVVENEQGRILLLDCAQYNFTPKLGDRLRPSAKCRLFHFKGSLKHYMAPYLRLTNALPFRPAAIFAYPFLPWALLKIWRLEQIRRAEFRRSEQQRQIALGISKEKEEQKRIEIKTLSDELRARNLTYCGYDKLAILHDCIADIERKKLTGRFIEAGVALGGSAIFICHYKSQMRRLDLYDVYDQIPAPGPEDGVDAHERYAEIEAGQSHGLGEDKYYGYLGDTKQLVTGNLKAFGFPATEHNIHLIKGLFQDTMNLTEPVALAHIDGDWYESVKTCIDRIAPHIVKGGYIIFDDYSSYSGCRKAVDQWLEQSPEFQPVIIKRSIAVQRKS